MLLLVSFACRFASDVTQHMGLRVVHSSMCCASVMQNAVVCFFLYGLTHVLFICVKILCAFSFVAAV